MAHLAEEQGLPELPQELQALRRANRRAAIVHDGARRRKRATEPLKGLRAPLHPLTPNASALRAGLRE
eukprot:10025441-Alexandrium_andersonii.AAC.1